MKRPPWLLIVIAVNLVVLVALAFVYPHLMVSPGPLTRGHAELATDCFACHAPWRGAAAQRCTECHALADIGLRSTQGVALPQQGLKTSFHQELIEQDCVACHSDHAGPKLTQRSRKPFSHDLLRVAARDRCESCHATPKDEVHRDLSVGCGQCHRPQAWKPATFKHALLAKTVLAQCASCHKAPADTLHRKAQGNCGQCHATTAWKPATFDHALLAKTALADCTSCHKPPSDTLHRQAQGNCGQCHATTAWKPASFDHALLAKATLAQCASCHKAPSDTLHRQAQGGNCGQCHATTAWKPATFEHGKFFVLDRDHNTTCVTCHTGNDYKRYTCYGCHEHTPAKVRAEHEEEGIRDFENCVECHRSADEEPAKRGARGSRERGRERERD